MNLEQELKNIDLHFKSIETEELIKKLIDCGLGDLQDSSEFGEYLSQEEYL